MLLALLQLNSILLAQAEEASETLVINHQNALFLLLGVLVSMVVAVIVGWILKRQPESVVSPTFLRTFNQRMHAWWVMWTILGASLLLDLLNQRAGYVATVTLFGLISFWALREFITMTPTRRGDHRTLFWNFFLITPLQFVLVGLGDDYYPWYSILIPVYACLFIPARIAFSGDPRRFLERSAKIQMGMLICVYALSHAPALLDLHLTTRPTTPPIDPDAPWPAWNGSTMGLLFYFVLVVQIGDVLQYAWGRLLGRRVIAPEISASRTWEGFFGGVACTSLVGASLYWVTPFTIWGSACMSIVIAMMGFAGGMVMSAIKRDRGVKDTGTLVQGHAGLLDRLDSMCFAAPVFFHLTKHILEV